VTIACRDDSRAANAVSSIKYVRTLCMSKVEAAYIFWQHKGEKKATSFFFVRNVLAFMVI
jgi:hypothetical protein